MHSALLQPKVRRLLSSTARLRLPRLGWPPSIINSKLLSPKPHTIGGAFPRKLPNACPAESLHAMQGLCASQNVTRRHLRVSRIKADLCSREKDNCVLHESTPRHSPRLLPRFWKLHLSFASRHLDFGLIKGLYLQFVQTKSEILIKFTMLILH